MPTELYTLQKEIIEHNQGHDRLLQHLGQQDNFTIDEFIIVEDVDYKIGMHPDAAPIRKLAADIINYSLIQYLGKDFISVAIRGDNRCSQRSLMSLTLIAARRLIYQGKKDEANVLLSCLGRYADELYARIDEPQFSALRVDFTQEHYQSFKTLLANIQEETIGITELVLQANSDFSVLFSPEADPFNLALSSLTAFIMDKKLDEQSRLINYPKEQLSDEENEYAVLTPGVRGSTSADRAAFLSALNLKLAMPILRVNSVVDTLLARGARTMDEAMSIGGGVFNLVATENDEGMMAMTAFNSGGHTNIVLTAEDRFYIEQELFDRRQKKSALPAGPRYHHDQDDVFFPEQTRYHIGLESDGPQPVVMSTPQDIQEHQRSDDQHNSEFHHPSTNYSFILKCLAGMAVVAGALMIVVGMAYLSPVLAGVGLGVAVVGGATLASMYGLFSGTCCENATCRRGAPEPTGILSM